MQPETTPNIAAPKLRLDALTSMRFVAAVMVVVFHVCSGEAFFAAVPLLLHSVIDCGYVWVGFFFVLSGFILSYQYFDRIREGRFSKRDFWVARFARIYPGHVVGFVLVLGLLLVKSWDWDFALPPGGAVVTYADVGATLALVHSWVPSFALTFNFPSWSISTEFFFYLCFPALAGVVVHWPLGRVIAFGVGTYAAAVVTNLVYCALDPYGWIPNDWAHDASRNFIKFFPLVRLPEFVMGVVAGRIFAERERIGLTAAVGVRLIACGTLAVLFGLAFGNRVPFALMHNVALSVPFVILVLGLALAPSSAGAKALSHRYLVALGEASYSVYILQAVVIWWLITSDDLRKSTDLAVAIPARVAVVLGVVLLALVSHRYLELPARERIRRLGAAGM